MSEPGDDARTEPNGGTITTAGDDRDAPIEKPSEPPVVARMVIEIRSDGTRTIARGAMEDVALGQRVAVEAEGTSPAALAGSLLKQLAQLPFAGGPTGLVKSVVKSLLPGRRRVPDDERED